MEINYRRPTTDSYVRMKVPNSILKRALQEEDGLEGQEAYLMDNSPSDNYGEWDMNMEPLLDIEYFRPHILDLLSSHMEEEYEDD